MTSSMIDKFCLSPIWDANLTWNTSPDALPDFTPCFHKTVLVYAPCAIFWFLSLLEYFCVNFKSTSSAPIPWSRLGVSKLVVTLILIIIALFEFLTVVLLAMSGTVPIVSADLVAPSIKASTYILSLVLMLRAKRAGLLTSGSQWIFWTCLSICDGFTFGSVVNNSDLVGLTWTSYSKVLLILEFVSVFCMFLLNCIAEKPSKYMHLDAHQISRPSPELLSSFISQLTFAWFETTVWKSHNLKQITKDDLWDLNGDDSVRTIAPKWEVLWVKSKTGPSGKHREGVARILFQSHWRCLIISGLWQFLYLCLIFVNPQILNLLIGYVEDLSEPHWHGYLYTVVLCLVGLVMGVADSNAWYMNYKIGLRLRTAISVAVYKKSLVLSSSSRRQQNAGEVVNLLSVDCQKLQDACQYINYIWSCPFQVGLTIYFLYDIIGWSVFVGLAVLLILLPFNIIAWAAMKRYQSGQMKLKDARVRIITEILSGIKVIKLFSWEASFIDKIGSIREDEVKQLKMFQYLEGIQLFIWNCSPLMVALASFSSFVLVMNGILDSQTVFVCLTFFNTMRAPLFLLPFGIVAIIQSIVAIKRIDNYLLSKELDPNAVSHAPSVKYSVNLHLASFSWDSQSEAGESHLKDLTWKVKRGSFVGVIGIVGSGKSSLLSALLGEMYRLKGTANVAKEEKLAYVPQQAWLKNTTLRNNVLFGNDYNEKKYVKIINACALKQDIDMMSCGDQTEIGEKGINLSGGQKQRISLARAAYSDATLYLLDDPLSAVDSHVGKHIFENVLGCKGILRDKTRILVTHAIRVLPEMDQIIVMKEGEIADIGTYEELLKKRDFAEFIVNQLEQETEKNNHGNYSGSTSTSSESEKESLRQLFGANVENSQVWSKLERVERRTRSECIEKSISRHDKGLLSQQTFTTSLSDTSSTPLIKEQDSFVMGRDLIEEEKAETHGVKFSIYLYYAKSVGLFLYLGAISYGCCQGFTIGGNLWLSKWSSDPEAVSNETTRNTYLLVYAVFGLLQSMFIFIAIILITLGTIRASVRMHKDMLERILSSTMAFFDTTPLGRIINRFSKDMDEVDLMIPTNIKGILNDFFSVAGTMVVVCYASPLNILVVIPIIGLLLFIQIRYLTLSRQLKRMVSVTTSPINSSLTESFSGASTIRAYKMEDYFIAINNDKVELNQVFYYPEIASSCWLSERLESIANILIFFACLFSVIYRDTADPGLVGLSLTYALTCQMDMFLLTRGLALLEKSIVSVERIKEYQNTPTEAPFEKESDDLLPSMWASEGAVTFQDYTTRYRAETDLVLKEISVKIAPREKVGIVGRTGAGKSSLVLALFRMIEAAEDYSGYISIDGVNIAHLGLKKLRNALTIIPQDPVLFSGTLRFNLDPFGKHSDVELWRTLELSHFISSSKNIGLDHIISDGGDNLSVGQRQLVCLARALLKKTKILVLDEATAAIDVETDDFIQETIKNEFSDCTILTIAHRLKTIMDSDKILLLNAGKVIEFSPPDVLLSNPNSAFYSMAKDAGIAC